MTKVEKFIELLNSQLDRGIYVWGGNGENISCMENPIDWIRRHETSVDNANRAETLYRSRVSLGVSPILAFDCSGLVYWALNQMGLRKDDISSRGLFALGNEVSRKDIQPGDLCFKWRDKNGNGKFDANEIYHVGVFDGKRVIECRGRDVGVCAFDIDNSWTKFCKLEALAEESAETEQTTILFAVTTPMQEGDAFALMQSALNAAGYGAGLDIDGVWGNKSQAAFNALMRAHSGVETEQSGVETEQYVFKRVLKYGSRGDDVIELKKLLINAGYSKGVTVNTKSSGNFYGSTRKAVKAYQRDNGLAIDGKAGKNTITALGGVWNG